MHIQSTDIQNTKCNYYTYTDICTIHIQIHIPTRRYIYNNTIYERMNFSYLLAGLKELLIV